jgi:iron(III) transport system substrate-binding protein
MVEHNGAQAAEKWLAGLVGNMARAPKGGDTDQIRAVASGECAIGVTNSYYLARLMRSDKPEDRAVMDKVAVVYPNQDARGTHMNIAGGAVARHSKNVAAAQRFLEYLASDDAQRYFAEGNNEWPAVASLKINNTALTAMGDFKRESIPISVIGMNQVKVQQMLDRVGYR